MNWKFTYYTINRVKLGEKPTNMRHTSYISKNKDMSKPRNNIIILCQHNVIIIWLSLQKCDNEYILN